MSGAVFDLDVTVIGGGIVGCAIAAELSGLGLETRRALG